LHVVLGLAAASATGLSVAALQAVTYPTPVTVDVSILSLTALSTFALMALPAQLAMYEAIADVVAPRFVETGMALLSFAYGNLSKMRSASFQPGGAHGGLPAGICAAIVDDDGVTPMVV
jgi:hypothetical protein